MVVTMAVSRVPSYCLRPFRQGGPLKPHLTHIFAVACVVATIAGCAHSRGPRVHVDPVANLGDATPLAGADGSPDDLWLDCHKANAKACYNLAVHYDVKASPRDASRYYQRACDGGIHEACARLARMYEDGRGVEADQNHATRLYTRACDAGVMPACTRAGAHYFYGQGVIRSLGRARMLFGKACMAGHARGCTWLARFYKGGVGVPVDAKVGRALFLHACALGDEQACNKASTKAGRALATNKPAGLDKLCTQGVGAACFALAGRYFKGDGVAEDASKVESLLARACKLHYADGCGGRLETPLFQPHSKDDIEPFAKACDAGSAAACRGFAQALLKFSKHDKAFHQRYVPAMERACRLGDAFDCEVMGLAFFRAHVPNKRKRVGISWTRAACRLGKMSECNRMGHVYFDSALVEHDDKRALKWFIRACDGGMPEACLTVAQGYKRAHNGVLAPIYFPRAMGGFAAYCEQKDDIVACAKAAVIALNKYGDVPPRQAAGWARKACEAKNAEGCYLLGRCYVVGFGVVVDYKHAVEVFDRACQEGKAAACTSAGFIADVHVKSLDAAFSTKEYQHGCDQGDAMSCGNLGEYFELGVGDKPDIERAVTFYNRACIGDNAYGCANLGYLAIHGKGVDQNANRGRTLYEYACKHGDPRACLALARHWELGTFGKVDKDKAKAYIAKVCGKRKLDACLLDEGERFETGDGAPRDPKRARAFFEWACQRGSQPSCKHLQTLKTTDTDEKAEEVSKR